MILVNIFSHLFTNANTYYITHRIQMSLNQKLINELILMIESDKFKYNSVVAGTPTRLLCNLEPDRMCLKSSYEIWD